MSCPTAYTIVQFIYLSLTKEQTSDIPPSSATVSVSHLPQITSSSTAAIVQSSSVHYEQQNISVASQPSSHVATDSDAHTAISSNLLTTSSEYLTTSNIDASINSGESISTVTTTVGM